MREIMFRGKSKFDGKWMEGFLFQTECDGVKEWCISRTPLSANDYSEILGDYAEVIPETIGQYTGLVDLKGKKIFEGDILKDVSDVGEERLYEVYYNEDLCAFMLDDQYWITPTRDWLSNVDKNPTTMMLQIVGNIHDNPELLKGGDE